ncbi:hypothetical protein [Methylobacterium sp. Leaf117]|uniref:hypothetical protein n=1 Tax=Methylobacterium sp. Leaf117 TaxID=1736260 RepID=UPI000B0F28F0|nr:hypothetical protein [Methylobacterium sp. Leaf117]
MRQTSDIAAAKAQADRDLRAVKDAAASLSAFRWSVERAMQQLVDRASTARASLDAYADLTGSAEAQDAIALLSVTAESAGEEAVRAILQGIPEQLPQRPCPVPA